MMMVPLETQAAGHGKDTGGQNGFLSNDAGFVFKPMQAPPKGLRELAFYQQITTSKHPVDQELVRLTPRFFGTQFVKVQDCGEDVSKYLVLENLTSGLNTPCIMDVKIGARTTGPDASHAKRIHEDAKYSGTKVPLGFSIQGIITNNRTGKTRLSKDFGKSLSQDTINEVLENFIQLDNMKAELLTKAFLKKLEEFISFFSEQRRYNFYASSLLFVYDSAAHDDGDEASTIKTVKLKLIDFAHVFPGGSQLDENFLFGLKNLSELFKRFIEQMK